MLCLHDTVGESIAFARRHQAVIERADLLLLWRNFSRCFSENHDGGTPAMRLGLRASPLAPRQLLRTRLFPSLVALPVPWWSYCLRLEDTPGTHNPVRYTLRLAC